MRKTVIIAASIVLLAILGGSGAYYYFVMDSAPSHVAKAPKPQPKFVALKPIVVNLQASNESSGNSYGSASYLQVGFKLATTNDKAVQAFKDMQPAIRGNVLDLLLEQPASVITSDAARKKMKAAVLKTVNQTIADQLDSAKKEPGFSKVYITRFVTQTE
ncbi:flagellar basal body-associated FliL family protein [Salinisphaera sp. RV14]|uniref:flagellar basal body-associated FliL family protein n=1 Tax=unclassified Salinisphaera TaxID=2649847 RepID=UPI003F86C807